MMPGTLAAALFADQVKKALRDSSTINYWIVAGVLVFYVVLALIVRRWLVRVQQDALALGHSAHALRHVRCLPGGIPIGDKDRNAMKSLKPLLLTFSLLAFTGAYAQDAKKEKDPTPAKPAMSQPESKSDKAAAGASAQPQSSQSSQMSAKKLSGMDVVDAQGKKLGDIDEVVLDMANGRVHAVVLGFGGFLGLGEKQFAFPVSDLQPAKDKNKLQLNVDKEKLKDREGFAKGKYPAMSDEYWARVGQGGKASAGAGQPAQKQSLARASKVIGQDVEDKSGKNVGEVKDIVLSSDRTRIQHVVVDVDEAGEATVQPKSLSMGKQGDKLVIDMSADQLKSQAKPTDKRAGARESKPSGSASTGTTTKTVPIEREDKPKESK